MRLINTETGLLEEFFDVELPPYAILSHRWLRGGETTFKDYNKGRNTESLGHRKIVDFCVFARNSGHRYVWADTVSIDKRSSAELSEAINSMYRWYAQSDVCYAYLNDIEPDELRGPALQAMRSIKRSNWFKRCWTLQELLAPRQVVFLSAKWTVLGRKVRRDDGVVPHRALLKSDEIQIALRDRTGIPIEVLRDAGLISRYTVAQRFSWAAGRKSTRVEDTAYSLLGLFGIAMPLLYGEVKRAFYRLQFEIIRSSTDQSIFAWKHYAKPSSRDAAQHILAESPNAFEDCGDIRRIARYEGPLPWTVTNHGMEIPLRPSPNIPYFEVPYPNLLTTSNGKLLVFQLGLNCEERKTKARCMILLVVMSCGHLGRVHTQDLRWESADTRGWTRIAANGNPTSIFAHLGVCEELAVINSGVKPGYND